MHRTARLAWAFSALAFSCLDFNGAYQKCEDEGRCATVQRPEVATSVVTVDRSTGVTADGVDPVTITVVVRNVRAQPMAGQRVSVTVSGDGNTVSMPAVTDENGSTTAKLTSTAVGVKTVRAAIELESESLQLDQTPTVTFVAGQPTRLRFNREPTGVARAKAFVTEVWVVDAKGNRADVSGSVTLALSGGPAAARLTGTATRVASVGSATFDDLQIDTIGQGYVLTATSPQYTASSTSPFEVTAGPPVDAMSSLVTATPTSASASGSDPIAVAVTLKDAAGNPLPGHRISLAVSGLGNTLTQPIGVTGADGTLTGSIRSTVPELKTVIATADEGDSEAVVLATQPRVRFTPAAPTLSLGTTAPDGGCLTISYTLSQQQQLPTDVRAEYAVGNGPYRPLNLSTDPTAKGLVSLATTSNGTPYTVSWSATTDLGRQATAGIKLRLTPSLQGVSGQSVTSAAFDLDLGPQLIGPAVTVAAAATPAFAVGDMNGDGLADVVTVLNGQLQTHRSTGAVSAFTPTTALSVSVNTGHLTLADFDDDGDLDAVTTEYTLPPTNSYALKVFLNDGTGQLSAGGNPGGGSGSPTNLSVADFNRDGIKDILVVSYFFRSGFPSSTSGSLFLGQRSSPPLAAPSGAGTYNPAIHGRSVSGDFNRDGYPDVAMVDDTKGIKVLLFSATTASPTNSNSAFLSGGSTVNALSAADVDRDGVLDLVAVGDGDAHWLRGQGDGTFATKVTLPVGAAASLKIADFDADGWADLVVGRTSGQVSLLLNAHDGTFRPAIEVDLSSDGTAVNAGDVQGDGVLDIFASSATGVVAVPGALAPWCNLTAQAPMAVDVDQVPVGLAVGDFNADGKLDIATSSGKTTNASVRVGNGDGSLRKGNEFANTLSSGAISADLDSDGKPDLITASADQPRLTVLYGQTNATFSSPQHADAGVLLGAFATGDVDGDGRADVVAVASQTNQAFVINAAATRAPLAPRPIGLSGNARSVSVADVDVDGRADLAVALVDGGVAVHLAVADGGVFGDARALPDAGNSTVVRLGLLDADQLPDLAALDETNAQLRTFFGNGDGSFHPGATVSTLPTPKLLALGDMTGDRHLDAVVVGGVGENNVQVLVNQAGAFVAGPPVSFGEHVSAVTLADMNSDGALDVVLATYDGTRPPFGSALPSMVVVALNRNDGSGGLIVPFSVDEGAGQPLVADFDRNGVLDVASGSTLRLGQPDGGFVAVALSAELSGATFADFNRDGFDDVVSFDGPNSRVRFFAGQGDGGFGAAVHSSVVATAVGPLTAADINRDGKLELLLPSSSTNAAYWLPNVAPGIFGAAQSVTAGYQSITRLSSVVAADFNRDGLLDVSGSPGGSVPAVALATAAAVFAAPSQITAFVNATNVAALSTKPGKLSVAAFRQNVVSDFSDTIELAPDYSVATVAVTKPWVGGGLRALVPIDVDRDGRDDVAAVCATSSTVAFSASRKVGGVIDLSPARVFSTTGRPNALAVGDLNRDGKVDFVVTTDTATGSRLNLVYGR